MYDHLALKTLEKKYKEHKIYVSLEKFLLWNTEAYASIMHWFYTHQHCRHTGGYSAEKGRKTLMFLLGVICLGLEALPSIISQKHITLSEEK